MTSMYGAWNEVPKTVILSLLDNMDSHSIYPSGFFAEYGITPDVAGIKFNKSVDGKRTIHDEDGEALEECAGASAVSVARDICSTLGIKSESYKVMGIGSAYRLDCEAIQAHFEAAEKSPLGGNPPDTRYTTEQALLDGCLVEPDHERWPHLLLSASIADVLNAIPFGRDAQIESFILDCIRITNEKAKVKDPEDLSPIEVHFPLTGTVWVVPNDLGGMTIMKPEDY